MDFDKESKTFSFTSAEIRIVAMDTAPLSDSGVVLGLLGDLRDAINGADVTHLPTPQDRRTFINQQAARIGLIDGMIEFITPYANEQMHQDFSRLLSEQ